MRGKVLFVYNRLPEFGDHPRLCGEKILPRMIIFRQKGSPPPMRGKATANTALMDSQRITPAYAGKSDSKAF